MQMNSAHDRFISLNSSVVQAISHCMESDWLTEAISNNPAWCHAIATSHGLPATLTEPAWFCQQPTPPLYPNIVTLQHGISIDRIIAAIDPELLSGWAIEDSICEFLDVEAFTLAFEAQWYCRNTRSEHHQGERRWFVT